jgi:hypothetical protein
MKLKNKVNHALEKCEQWMMSHIEAPDFFTRKTEDPVSYYKWPLALLARGKKNEARQILDWINKNCLTDAGDYISNRSGFHQEFHTYSTLWMTLAAMELGDDELVNKQLSFILQYHNRQNGGLATYPADKEMITEDPVSTAFLGMVACGLKDRELADSILHFFERLVSQDIRDNQLWIRTRADGSIIRNIPKNADPKTYVINLGQKEECYYFLGAACYFLGRYIETFSSAPIMLANKYAALLEKCGKEALDTIWAAKVAPGCALLYSVSGDQKFLDLSTMVMKAVLGCQHEDGYWVKGGKPWVTVSAEQCYWLTDISKRIELL